MKIYKITLKYQNIESGGSAQYTAKYNLKADSYIAAIEMATQKLSGHRDGKLYSIYAEEILLD